MGTLPHELDLLLTVFEFLPLHIDARSAFLLEDLVLSLDHS